MYPIDAIKVRRDLGFAISNAVLIADRLADPNADPQSHPFRCLQWYDTRRLSNSLRGRLFKPVARHVKRGSWGRLVNLGWLVNRAR
jgi:hypothetical protein